MLYRVMNQEDTEEVFLMNQEYFSESWSLKQIQEIPTEESMLYVVAQQEEGQICGYCGLYQVLDEGNITQVAVKKEFRGKRIATEMLAKLLALAKEKEMNFFTLEVRASNKAAIALYESAGFVAQGRRKNYYTDPVEDGIIMNIM